MLKMGVELQTLTREFLESHYEEFLYLEKEWITLGDRPWNREKFFRQKPRKWELSSYATLDGRIIGYTIVSQPDEKRPEAFLHKILVDSDYKGLGIGSKLFEDTLEKCKSRGLEKLTFKVRVENESAISLYRKYGVDFKEPIESKDNIERYQCELNLK